eukprot:CAMPEP_0202693532 /NCGR_PEP_ID=MMETSP1385-20130828/7619_1 /ASSEMBLY_ACC=CAM_ASM_000861 /TAXON_ID=933848 /ORGANISM="Elphidium margaritaceum" /LENGTH=416 /DNA_ID=CAMNT_0049349221 /DNA_START=116 /DNA_END=1366 /DNA_ORIENTATION=-
MGSYLEFTRNPSQMKVSTAMSMPGGGTWGNRITSGQVTDDTELAVSLCRGLVKMIEASAADKQLQPKDVAVDESDDKQQDNTTNPDATAMAPAVSVTSYDSAYIAHEYRAWYESDPFDMGRCTAATTSRSNACDMKKAAVVFDEACQRMHKSAGNLANGSLMRCMPLIVYGYKLSASDLYALMAEDSSLTHANRIIYVANTCYAIAAQYLLQQGSDQNDDVKNDANDDDETTSISSSKDSKDSKRNRMAIAASEAWLQSHINYDDDDDDDAFTQVHAWLMDCKQDDLSKLHPAHTFIGFAKIAFQRAFYHLYHASSFETAMKSTLGEGGDTDTNCCIVGGLLGCYYGSQEIPKKYMDTVMQSKPADDRDCEFQAKLYTEQKYIETLIENAPTKLMIKSYSETAIEQESKNNDKMSQ